MSSLVVRSSQIIAFILATVALFLNINAAVGLSTNQRTQLTVSINLLGTIPYSYGISIDNVTVNVRGLWSLGNCTQYVQDHIPVVPPFNTTIVINTTVASTELTNLTEIMEGRGTIVIEKNGTTRVTETNATLQYAKEYITFGNVALYYIGIEPGQLMTVSTNGTVGLTFTNWTPSIGLYGSSGYNAIYDENQLDIQSALPIIRVEKKQYGWDGSISVDESMTAINEGDVVSVTRKLQL